MKQVSRAPAWTTQEDDIIRLYYPEHGAPGVHKYLPHRFYGGIQRRAAYLGVKTTHRGDRAKLKSAIECSIRKLGNEADKNWR